MTGHGKSQDMVITGKGPWKDFKDTLENLGCRFVTELEPEKVDALIVNNFSRYSKKMANRFSIKKHRMVYIIWEPRVVDPRRYKYRVLKNFGVIFSPSPLWITGKNVQYFNWPQIDFDKTEVDFKNWENRKNKSIMVAANKYSICKGEQYGLRRNLSIHLSLTNSLDLFGHDWNKGFYHDFKLIIFSILKSKLRNLKPDSTKGIGKSHGNYLGALDDKFQKIKEYRINVVIENSSDYISEKLFDSISCGAITIYVGPELAIFGLPKDIAITVPPDITAISDTINKLLALPVHEQKIIAQKQLEALLPYANAWEGSETLTLLAAKIFDQLSKQGS
jgi:hypothetical protein